MARKNATSLSVLLVFLGSCSSLVRADEPQTEPISRILFGSCARQDQPIPIFDTIVASKPDVFLFLGGNIYADTTDMKVMSEKYAKLKSHAIPTEAS